MRLAYRVLFFQWGPPTARGLYQLLLSFLRMYLHRLDSVWTDLGLLDFIFHLGSCFGLIMDRISRYFSQQSPSRLDVRPYLSLRSCDPSCLHVLGHACCLIDGQMWKSRQTAGSHLRHSLCPLWSKIYLKKSPAIIEASLCDVASRPPKSHISCLIHLHLELHLALDSSWLLKLHLVLDSVR